MEIISFNTIESTQKYLVEALEKEELKAPIAIITANQTIGIGSRDNSWKGGEDNFFASIALNLDTLPDDLPLSSASIYFSFIMKKILVEMGEKIWLKWPNDFYLNNNKIGGTITQKVGNILVCGIGINLKKSDNSYSSLESNISPKVLLKNYILSVKKLPTWKQIFSEYKIEFELSKRFSVHIQNSKKSLSEAILCDDGSLMIENKKLFSLR